MYGRKVFTVIYVCKDLLIFVLVLLNVKEYFLGVLRNLRHTPLFEQIKNLEPLHYRMPPQSPFSIHEHACSDSPSSVCPDLNDATYNRSDSLNRRLYV
jgi:hypothetical protein